MTAKGRYVVAICLYCQTKQAVDAEALCKDQNPPVVLGKSKSRLKVTCANPECRRTFTIEIDCSEYK